MTKLEIIIYELNKVKKDYEKHINFMQYKIIKRNKILKKDLYLTLLISKSDLYARGGRVVFSVHPCCSPVGFKQMQSAMQCSLTTPQGVTL